MASESGARDAMKREVQSIRAQKERLGVDDLGDLDELGGRIVDAVDHRLYVRGLDADIHAVYICGSFAEGTATETFSDLDVRVVIDRIPEMDREEIEHDLRVYDSQGIVPDVCGYLDAHVAPEPPVNRFPSVCIWEGNS